MYHLNGSVYLDQSQVLRRGVITRDLLPHLLGEPDLLRPNLRCKSRPIRLSLLERVEAAERKFNEAFERWLRAQKGD